MRVFCKRVTVILGTGLLFGLICALPGCDSSGAKTEYKPIESNILKKLGGAGQAQSEAAKAEHPSARAKKKKRYRCKKAIGRRRICNQMSISEKRVRVVSTRLLWL